ncbi:PTPA-CTERM sorting domain-containing protein [Leptolyngbya sp. GB1-A1]|uniref:PTPA-CTERM sorting domain-containing protein n=1 Tax=Leptolyngbya sp. GB1-A1 TaxID=2933908 RepID=UPI003299CA73
MVALKMKTALTVASAACVALGTAAPSLAGSLTFSGTTAGQPTWNRPVQNGSNAPTALSAIGTNVPFSTFGFTVDTTGLYNFLSVGTDPAGWDNYTFLYQGDFNPTQPLTNVLRGNDDFPGIGVSGFNDVSLVSGLNYFLITTGFDNSNAGRFDNTISGVGNISEIGNPQPIPTPALLPGLIGMGIATLRKRKGEAAQETSKA